MILPLILFPDSIPPGIYILSHFLYMVICLLKIATSSLVGNANEGSNNSLRPKGHHFELKDGPMASETFQQRDYLEEMSMNKAIAFFSSTYQ